jgi:fatty acid desaturase
MVRQKGRKYAGSVVFIPTAALTILIFASALWGGMWTLGHAAPLLLVSIPGVLVGTAIVMIGFEGRRELAR